MRPASWAAARGLGAPRVAQRSHSLESDARERPPKSVPECRCDCNVHSTICLCVECVYTAIRLQHVEQQPLCRAQHGENIRRGAGILREI